MSRGIVIAAACMLVVTGVGAQETREVSVAGEAVSTAPAPGKVTGTRVRVRTGPGTKFSKLYEIHGGQRVPISHAGPTGPAEQVPHCFWRRCRLRTAK